jgi:hypothetical protein
MKRVFKNTFAVLATVLALSACEKYEIDDHAEPTTAGARVKFYQNSQDATMVNFILNDMRVTGATPSTSNLLRGLAYNTSGLNSTYPTLGYANVASGDYALKVVVPEGSGTTIPAPGSEYTSAAAQVKLDDMTSYSMFLLGRAASLETLVLKDNIPAAVAGKVHVRFVHTMASAPSNFDVKFTKTDVTPNETNILATNVAMKGATEFVEMPAGTYTYVISPTGTSTVYATGSLTLGTGRVYTMSLRGNYVATITASTPVLSVTINR